MEKVSIGKVARDSGVKVPTVRYYESIGLLPSPERSANGRRVYDGRTIDRLSFIRHARAMDFDIEDIRSLLALREASAGSCGTADAIARAKLADVDERISRLMALRAELSQMIDRCANEEVATCKVLAGLS